MFSLFRFNNKLWVLLFITLISKTAISKPKCTVNFDDNSINLGDMTSSTVFGFTYSKCKNYSISFTSDNTLSLQSDSSHTIMYTITINGNSVIRKNKKNITQTATITPDVYPSTQRAGTYVDDIIIVISAP